MSADLECWEKFCVLQPIGAGEGANSTTYLAYDPQLQDVMVAKFVKIEDWRDPGAFLKEARILNSVSHPNVVKLSGCGFVCDLPQTTHRDSNPGASVVDLKRAIDQNSTSGAYWIKQSQQAAKPAYFVIKSPVADSSLQPRIDVRSLTNREVIRITLSLLQGLGAAHSAGILHLDLKPSNILVKDSTPLLTDFGISAWVGPQGFAIQPRFYRFIIPPEVFVRGPVVDLRADIFQLGTCVYRMCNTNYHWHEQKGSFFNGNSLDGAKLQSALAGGRFPSKTKFLAHVPPKLRNIVSTALSVNPDGRYRSCLEFQAKLAALNGAQTLWDWRCAHIADDSTVYEETKLNRLVEVRFDGTTWSVSAWTNNGGKRRAVTKYAKGGIQNRSLAEEDASKVIQDWTK